MPGGDRTGPWGAGPMTGRGFGPCGGFGHRGMGRGGGATWRGWGGGRGWRRGLSEAVPGPRFGFEPVSTEDAREVLTARVKWLEDRLAATKERLAQLEKESVSDGPGTS